MIELGMPFTDPMADGPAVQAAGQRALKAGQTLRATLAMVAAFRARDPDTPLVLDGLLQPDLRLWRRAVSPRRADRGSRRAHRRRLPAGGGR